MFKSLSSLKASQKISAIGLSFGVIGSCLFAEFNSMPKGLTNPSFFEYRWDGDSKYKKLYYTQSSKERRDRSTYYLVMREKDRKTAILKLSIVIPDYFKANITPRKLHLCRVSLGGMLERTRCLEKLPAVFEVSENQTKIEAFPEQPIPTKGSYAVVMKIFNPGQTGMFQLSAMSQAPGDVPISSYIGTWNIDIE